MSDGPPFQYIVLHESVRDHPGVIAVHAAHAAGESCFEGPALDDTRVVVLVAQDSEELVDLSRRLTEARVRHALIVETDGLRAGQATALGTMPTRDRTSVSVFFPREQFKVLR